MLADMSDAKLTRDLNRVGEPKRVSVPETLSRSGRPIVEILAEAQSRNLDVVLDGEFRKDVAGVIANHE